jgi:hypothetical protein
VYLEWFHTTSHWLTLTSRAKPCSWIHVEHARICFLAVAERCWTISVHPSCPEISKHWTNIWNLSFLRLLQLVSVCQPMNTNNYNFHVINEKCSNFRFSYHSVTFINCEPVIHNKFKLLSSLNIFNNYATDKPRRFFADPGAIMPDAYVAQVSKWSLTEDSKIRKKTRLHILLFVLTWDKP